MAPAPAVDHVTPELPLPGPALRLEVPTDLMTCTAFGSPAVYAFDGALRLRWTSSEPPGACASGRWTWQNRDSRRITADDVQVLVRRGGSRWAGR